MSAVLLVVRAEVPDPTDRASFDHWYATDHLPCAIRVFGARRGWRCWSRTDPAVHYAFYEFADVDEAQAARDPGDRAGDGTVDAIAPAFAGKPNCHCSRNSLPCPVSFWPSR